MTEPRLPYGRQCLGDDDIEAVAEVLRGEWLTTGPRVGEFERALAARVGVRHAVVVNSGTAALHAAYAASGLGPGDEVITSPLTFVATASTAIQLGATVRFADVEAATGLLDPEAARAAIRPSSKVLAPIDYAGHPADYDALRSVAEPHGLTVIADAAHSFGALRGGRPAGSLADMSATSFHPVKPLTTGEGGAVLTDGDAWRTAAARFRDHGIVREGPSLRRDDGPWYYEVQSLGLNYRLPDILCALGLSQLRKLTDFLGRRREIAAFYSRELASIDGVALPRVEADTEPGWHLYVIRVEQSRRRAFFERLRERGLGVQVHYPPVHLHPYFRDLGHAPGECPRAEEFAARAVSLPIFPLMTDADAQRVVETVAAVAGEEL